MNTVENAANESVKTIIDIFDGRLIHQFRKPNWIKEFSVGIAKSLKSFGVEVTKSVNEDARSKFEKEYTSKLLDAKAELDREIRSKLENKYKDYIKKPSTGTAARWKFLFTGKLD